MTVKIRLPASQPQESAGSVKFESVQRMLSVGKW